MKTGEIKINTLAKDKTVEISIEDTGMGIAEQDLKRVLDPFFTTKAPGSGTGLGLSITQSILEQHHGTIQISPGINEGTIVTIEIPKYLDTA